MAKNKGRDDEFSIDQELEDLFAEMEDEGSEGGEATTDDDDESALDLPKEDEDDSESAWENDDEENPGYVKQ